MYPFSSLSPHPTKNTFSYKNKNMKKIIVYQYTFYTTWVAMPSPSAPPSDPPPCMELTGQVWQMVPMV